MPTKSMPRDMFFWVLVVGGLVSIIGLASAVVGGSQCTPLTSWDRNPGSLSPHTETITGTLVERVTLLDCNGAVRNEKEQFEKYIPQRRK